LVIIGIFFVIGGQEEVTNLKDIAMEKRICGCGMRPKTKEEINAELRKDAAGIVAGVEGYSRTDRANRAAEVKAAFPPVAAKTTTRRVSAKPAAKTTARAAAKSATAAKTTKRGPTPAGISTGPHDGDVC
jgi:hypothetical protein